MSLMFLTNKATLWLLFALTVVLSLLFAVVILVWDFMLIDEMFDARQIADHIAALSTTQKKVHIWTTATVDVLYPFAYSGLFAGIALKAFGRAGLWLALPALSCIPVDLTEGFAQVMLLSGNDGYMSLKTLCTPIKLALLFASLIIAILGLLKLYMAAKASSESQ